MKKFKTVLVGCGGISRAWLDVIVPHAAIDVKGLVDLNIENARERAHAYALTDCVTSDNLDACLDATGAELVLDCTVPSAHREVLLTAVRHGCHVFGEKPLAETMDDARMMVAAAQAAGVTYGVMQNRRWQAEGIGRVRAALEQGVIGTLHSVHADFFIGARFGGFRETMRHVLLLDMAIHSFDQIRFLLKARPLSVWASDWNPPGSWYGDGASAVAFFEHEDHCRSSYRGSWCAEGLNSSWQCTWRMIGDNGTLLWDGEKDIHAERPTGADGFIRPCTPVDIPPAATDVLDAHAGAIHDFIDGLSRGRPPATPATDNIHSLAMVHGAIQSAESGQVVSLSQLINGAST